MYWIVSLSTALQKKCNWAKCSRFCNFEKLFSEKWLFFLVCIYVRHSILTIFDIKSRIVGKLFTWKMVFWHHKENSVTLSSVDSPVIIADISCDSDYFIHALNRNTWCHQVTKLFFQSFLRGGSVLAQDWRTQQNHIRSFIMKHLVALGMAANVSEIALNCNPFWTDLFIISQQS